MTTKGTSCKTRSVERLFAAGNKGNEELFFSAPFVSFIAFCKMD
jgi:hypothetical protein